MKVSGEFGRIARHFAPLAGSEALGLADDAAIWTPPAGRQAVFTVDQMIEGVHFLAEDPPSCIARKLLRRNLSDLAAMGARAEGYLLTTALRADTSDKWLADFAHGLALDQERYVVALWGGDSSSTPGPIMTSVTMIGSLVPGTALRRSGACDGDALFVTGTVGDAVLGLHAAWGRVDDPTGHFRSRRLLPEPRTGLALAGIAHAVIDVSDGLVQDLAHICTVSGLGAVIEAARVPLSPAGTAAGVSWREAILTGGDDYELLIAAPPEAETALREACGEIPLSRIGRFAAEQRDVGVIDEMGQPIRLARAGWQHF